MDPVADLIGHKRVQPVFAGRLAHVQFLGRGAENAGKGSCKGFFEDLFLFRGVGFQDAGLKGAIPFFT